MSAVLQPRDLASAESIAARNERITARDAAFNARADRINKALTVLSVDCTTEADAVRALHAISAGLMTTKPTTGTDIYESVELIDGTAETIQWRHEPS